MIFLLILLISLCDIHNASVPDDSFFKEFSVTKPLDETWTGCEESSFPGGTVDLTILKQEPLGEANESLVSPMSPASMPEETSFSQLQSAIAPFTPPDDEHYNLTPEPAAIIGLTGLLLLLLLLGRRLLRRT
jgi:hypothetical protein